LLSLNMGKGEQGWDKRLIWCMNPSHAWTQVLSFPLSRLCAPGASSISSGTGCGPRCRSRSAIVSAPAVMPTWRGSSRRAALGLPSPACVPRDRPHGMCVVSADHAPSVPGETSHGICPPCAAPVLTPLSAMAWLIPSRSLGGQRGRSVARIQLPKHVRKTGKANTMADLPSCPPRGALPAHGLLAPGAHNLERGLLGYRPPRLAD